MRIYADGLETVRGFFFFQQPSADPVAPGLLLRLLSLYILMATQLLLEASAYSVLLGSSDYGQR